MNIQWTPDLRTGILWQDKQHQELFRRAKELSDLVDNGASLTEIKLILSYLESYVDTHFLAEEEAMRKLHYPAHAEHLAEHESFKSQLSQITLELKSENSQTKAIQLLDQLIGWLKNHIGGTDKELGQFLQTHAGVVKY